MIGYGFKDRIYLSELDLYREHRVMAKRAVKVELPDPLPTELYLIDGTTATTGEAPDGPEGDASEEVCEAISDPARRVVLLVHDEKRRAFVPLDGAYLIPSAPIAV